MLALLAGLVVAALTRGADSKEYCHNEEFTAECTDGTVILMTSALYGRMTIGPCVKTDFGFVGCFTDVIAHAHERCSGRTWCSIRVPDATLDMTRPCNEDLKSYLEVSYSCVKVANPVTSSTHNQPFESPCNLTAVTSDAIGYLSNRYPVSNPGARRCGTESDPWIVNVLPGQRINITLLDFTAALDSVAASKSVERKSRTTTLATTTATTPAATTMTTVAMVTGCDRYVVVTDQSDSEDQHRQGKVSVTASVAAQGPSSELSSELCGTGGIRQSLVSSQQQSPQLKLASSSPPSHGYSSVGRTLKITLHHIVTPPSGTAKNNANDTIGYNFLLKYEAVGCPDPKTPTNGWFKRNVNQMTAGCVTSGVTWTLACVGTRWQGTSFNCSLESTKDRRQGGLITNLSMGESLLIILIVSLAIGVIILLLGVLYYKRRRDMSSNALTRANRQLRDLKPLNALSDESAYDSTPTGVYARNVAFDPPTRVTSCRLPSNANQRNGNTSVNDVDGDNEYEYVWDAAAGSAEVHCGGSDVIGRKNDHVTATFRRDLLCSEHVGGGPRTGTRSRGGQQQHVVSASGTGSRHHQCGCMTPVIGSASGDQTMRTMMSSQRAPRGTMMSSKHAPRDSASSTNAATVGRFGHLENRSSSSRTTGASCIDSCSSKTFEKHAGDVPRICPHCEHPITVPSNRHSETGNRKIANACSAGTPLADVRQHRLDHPTIETVSHRHQPVTSHPSSVRTHRRM